MTDLKVLQPIQMRRERTNNATRMCPFAVQGCQFSDFSLISDFLRIKETGIQLIKYGQNIVKVLIVTEDRLDSGKGLDNPSLKTVSKH